MLTPALTIIMIWYFNYFINDEIIHLKLILMRILLKIFF